ncbi:MAG: hypothetical protein IKL55_06120 [Clostridia bacterium]|nr:hypothetical protein [Clostridia bacterium]MBR3614736.1 hypothetical protein [Clostridia bacterium]
MTIIFTENDELNEELEKNIEGSRIAYYTKYLLEEKDADIVILTIQDNKFEFEKFLYELRKRNIRVILLLENEKQKETEIAIRLGIYDLVFGTFALSDVLKLVKNANNFSNIAEIYRKKYKVEVE